MQKIHPQPTIASCHLILGKRIKRRKKSAIGILEVVPNSTLQFVDPDRLIGYSFATAGETQRVEVKGREGDKYHVEYADEKEDHSTYAEIINLLKKETEDGPLWRFLTIDRGR